MQIDPISFAMGIAAGGLLIGLLVLLSRRRTALDTSAYVARDTYDQLQQTSDLYLAESREREQQLRELDRHNAALQEARHHLQVRLDEQARQQAEQQQLLHQQFEQISDQLLKARSQELSAQNESHMQSLIAPFKSQLAAYNEALQHRAAEENRERTILNQHIAQLKTLNHRLSEDARQLTAALRGDNKTAGDWGELQLETLLEHAGLRPETHYLAQPSYTASNQRQYRPDFVIKLPEQRHLIVDAKVSLKAYEAYCSTDDDSERQVYLQQHIRSVRSHMKGLHDKEYHKLDALNCPDYVFLFVPIEPAFVLAMMGDPQLYKQAIDLNIVLVTPSTLLATMRTVAYLWKQERQRENVRTIIKAGSKLHHKLCLFVESMEEVGRKLDGARESYGEAMNRLSTSPKKGATVIGLAERLSSLGAGSDTKSLPAHLVARADDLHHDDDNATDDDA